MTDEEQESTGVWRVLGRTLLRMLAGLGHATGGVGLVPLPPPPEEREPGPEEWWQM